MLLLRYPGSLPIGMRLLLVHATDRALTTACWDDLLALEQVIRGLEEGTYTKKLICVSYGTCSSCWPGICAYSGIADLSMRFVKPD